MERESGNLEDGGPYLPLLDDGVEEVTAIVSDDNRLKQLGYKQELSRRLSAIANFSVTFSIISVITGLSTLFDTGLTYGGPLTMVYGWPTVGVLTLIVGLSMAEICSAFPTSGGLYFWSAKLCGQDWGPFASWITGWSKYWTRDWWHSLPYLFTNDDGIFLLNWFNCIAVCQ